MVPSEQVRERTIKMFSSEGDESHPLGRIGISFSDEFSGSAISSLMSVPYAQRLFSSGSKTSALARWSEDGAAPNLFVMVTRVLNWIVASWKKNR